MVNDDGFDETLDDTEAVTAVTRFLASSDYGDEFDPMWSQWTPVDADHEAMNDQWCEVADEMWRRGWLNVDKIVADVMLDTPTRDMRQ